MGVDFTSYAFIGQEIEKGKLFQTPITVKAFNHDYDESIAYCPKTGKKLWTTESPPIPEYDDHKDRLGKYKIVTDTDCSRWFVSILYAESDGSRSSRGNAGVVPLPEGLLGKTEEFKQFMKSIGLWDESKFGLHAVLYCSY